MKFAKMSRVCAAAAICALLAFPAVAGARTDAPLRVHPHAAAAVASSAAPVREVRTVVMDDRAGSTLTLVIAIAALAVALSGTAYLALRVRPMLRT